MPSAAFTAWLADTATDRVVLADVQLAEQTSGDGWTVDATYTNSYTLSWSNFIGSGGDAVYRRIDKVRENATDYTERVDEATVDANASSWYYDEANTTIYVRTSTGSDPDTFSSITVYHCLLHVIYGYDHQGIRGRAALRAYAGGRASGHRLGGRRHPGRRQGAGRWERGLSERTRFLGHGER